MLKNELVKEVKRLENNIERYKDAIKKTRKRLKTVNYLLDQNEQGQVDISEVLTDED